MNQNHCSSASKIQKVGKVTAASASHIWVDVKRDNACDHCRTKSSCGVSLMEKLLGPRDTRLKAENMTGAIVGEEVILSVNESALVKAALLAYLIPLIVMAVGASLLQPYGNIAALVGAASGLLTGLLASRFITNGRLAAHFTPRVSPKFSPLDSSSIKPD